MGQIRIRDTGGTLRTVTRIRARDDQGTLRTIQRVRVRDAGGILRTVFQYLVATVSPSSLTASAATATITTTGSATVTVTGGTAPYTYAWGATDDYLDSIAATSPTSATTTFRRTSCISGDIYLARFFCRVTDAAGSMTQTDLVDVQITRT
jgi:SprB repeat